jgi:hypothetical protein
MAGPILALERWQDPVYIQQSFLEIALQREYDSSSSHKLVRWQKPIQLYFESDFGDSHLQRELLTVQMNHLSHITGIAFQFVPTAQTANLLVVFTRYEQLEAKVSQYIGDPDRIRAALDEAICLGNFRVNRQSHIERGAIIIPVDYARQKARFLDCIVEEITQLMGLPNDSDRVFPSIFNDVSVDTYLSPLDYLLLKLLYSPRLAAGMTTTEVIRLLPLAIRDLKAFGEIQQAAIRVRQYSMQDYLGD